jgi:hypothetical protein
VLFRLDSNKRFPSESLLFTILQGASQLFFSSTSHVVHVVWPKEMVKHQHVGVPSILGSHRRLDVDKTIMLASDVGHDVLNLASGFHKSSPRVRGALAVIS